MLGQCWTEWDRMGQNLGHVQKTMGQLWDNVGQLRTTTPRNNHVEPENSEGQKTQHWKLSTRRGKNSALGKLSTLTGYIYISHSDEVYRRCCTWGFGSCAVRQVIMSRRARVRYYAEKSLIVLHAKVCMCKDLHLASSRSLYTWPASLRSHLPCLLHTRERVRSYSVWIFVLITLDIVVVVCFNRYIEMRTLLQTK